MGEKNAFDVLQMALEGAIQLRLEKTVNGAIAFMLGLLAVGLSKYETGAASWTSIVLGGAAMLVGVFCLGFVALQPSPPVTRPPKPVRAHATAGASALAPTLPVPAAEETRD